MTAVAHLTGKERADIMMARVKKKKQKCFTI